MNNEWHERFAASAGKVTDAQVDSAGNIGFGSTVLPGVMSVGSAQDYPAPALVELSRLAVIDFVGEDAAEFLQAQVCNDLTAISTDQAQINGYCSPKGRLLALFTVFAHENGNRIVLPADVAPAFIKRLQMFVLRAKVSITHRTDLVCTGLVLDAETRLDGVTLTDAFPDLPEQVNGLSGNDAVQVVRCNDDPGKSPHPANDSSAAKSDSQNLRARYLLIGSADTLFPLWESEQFSHAAWSYWRYGDINAGMPNVFAESADQFIPLMLNMQFINALSFKKGCYPGQEIVARMYYLGKLKKHMKHLYLAGATAAPQPGTTLTTESNNNAGQVVDAVADEGGVNLLAVVNIETPVSDLQLAGQGLTDAQVPYSLLPDPDDNASSESSNGA